MHNKRLTKSVTAPPVLSNISATKNTSFDRDTDHFMFLCEEVVCSHHSVLVFCPTKDRCNSCALMVASGLSDKALQVNDEVYFRIVFSLPL